jgi:Uma2 family endonuclease
MSASPTRAERRPLRRVEYDQLVASGAFQDERIELLDGVLVRQEPQGPEHVHAVHAALALLRDPLGNRATVWCRAPLALSATSEPEPDVSVVPPGAYTDHLPERVFLIVEVADATLTRDLGLKARLYARAEVPEYWVVDLRGRKVWVHLDPAGDEWRSVVAMSPEDVLSPRAFPHVRAKVAALLP